MATLRVTTRDRITLPKQTLRHLGIEPGGEVELDMLPRGQAVTRRAAKRLH